MTGMKWRIVIAVLLMTALGAKAQEGGQVAWSMKIDTVSVKARQVLSDIGIQQTLLDSVALRENVANSLGDVLAQNTSVFIKSYGRGTLSTASFRGTAASHTQVTWNGMKMNSPMLGMVDLSLVPSYFIDDAALFHGASSVGVAGGGLGGAVALATKRTENEGFGARFIQGISSFSTFDEFLHLTYGQERWQLETRVYYAKSDNDFIYTNYHRKEYVKDDEGNIVDRYYPRERNKNGFFRDFHILQQAYMTTRGGDKLGVSAWYMDSHRGLPMLTVDRRTASQHKEEQEEKTFRAVADWERSKADFSLQAKAGYLYSDYSYIYQGDKGTGELSTMIDSYNYLNTLFAEFGGEYYIGNKWVFTGNAAFHQNMVDSRNMAVENIAGETQVIGYDKSRPEISVFASVKYRPHERVGLSASMREEWYGKKSPKFIPAAFVEYMLLRDGTLKLKASAARNYRFPTLNDMYFKPGGNPELKPEHGFTYDASLAYDKAWDGISLKAEGGFFDSYIDDWILWILERPYPRPVNVKEVRSCGVEFKWRFTWRPGRNWNIDVSGNYTVTKTENRREPFSQGDASIGKQLPYIPKYSAAALARVVWRKWEVAYKWQYYSERYTTSSNETSSLINRLDAYYMSDISLAKAMDFRWGRVALKFAVNNLFGEEYESVLSRPMPERNYGFFIEITPRFGRK